MNADRLKKNCKNQRIPVLYMLKMERILFEYFLCSFNYTYFVIFCLYSAGFVCWSGSYEIDFVLICKLIVCSSTSFSWLIYSLWFESRLEQHSYTNSIIRTPHRLADIDTKTTNTKVNVINELNENIFIGCRRINCCQNETSNGSLSHVLLHRVDVQHYST